MVGEDAAHLGGRLQPLLLGIMHSRGIVEIFSCAEADEAVVRLAVFLFHKVNVVGGDDLNIVFLRQVEEYLVHLFLAFIHFRVASRLVSLMPLHLKIIILAKQVLEPLYGGFGSRHIAVHDLLRHLARQTGGAANQAFVVFLKQAVVDAGIVVEAFGVGDGAQFAEAVVARLVFGQ